MEEDEPTIHIWSGIEDIPDLVPLEIESFAMAGALAIPPDVIARRSKGLKTEKLASKGWKIVQGEMAIVYGDLYSDELKAIAVYVPELYVMLRSYLSGPDFDGVFLIRAFKNAGEYRRYAVRAGASNAESFYDPRSAEIVMDTNPNKTPYLFQRAFAHEFVHAYVDQVWDKTSPLWLMEGIAEWFSNIHWRGDILIPGQMMRQALFRLSMSTHSLRELLTVTRDQMYGFDFEKYYAEAWSLVDFVMTRMPYGTIQQLLNMELSVLDGLQDEWEGHIRMMVDSSGV